MRKQTIDKLLEFIQLQGDDARRYLEKNPDLLGDDVEAALVALSEQSRGHIATRVAVEQVRFLFTRCKQVGLEKAFQEHENAASTDDMLEFLFAATPEERAAVLEKTPRLVDPPTDVFLEENERGREDDDYAMGRYRDARLYLRLHRHGGPKEALATASKLAADAKNLNFLVFEFLALETADAAVEFADRHPLILTQQAEKFLVAFEEVYVKIGDQDAIRRLRNNLRYLRACRALGVRQAFREGAPFRPNDTLFGPGAPFQAKPGGEP